MTVDDALREIREGFNSPDPIPFKEILEKLYQSAYEEGREDALEGIDYSVLAKDHARR